MERAVCRVIIEALSCGVPVVGSESGEIPWLIGLTGGGVTFPEGNVTALSCRLADLRADPDLRAHLATEGRAAVERMFTVAAVTDAFQQLLELSAEDRGLPRRPKHPNQGPRLPHGQRTNE
jgi:glycosyltransferase involved in cell wall biosynthesis